MAVSGSLQLSLQLGICRNHGRSRRLRQQISKTRRKLSLFSSKPPSIALPQYSQCSSFSKRIHREVYSVPCRNHGFSCRCSLSPSPSLDANILKNASLTFTRLLDRLQGSPLVIKLGSAFGILLFAAWGLGPVARLSRNIFLRKSDNNWKKSNMYHVTTSYIQPLLLWIGAIFICRTLDPMVLPTEAGQLVKQRLLNFVRSLSTVLAFAYCLSSVIQQAQKFFMETNAATDTRNMGFQFAGRAVYSAVWVAAVSLFMELLGFSTQKWLTAGGLGTVLLTLAGREIFTNFLSSAMIHATRPFVVNEWIQTKIEGYEVSGTVEHVGWWSPTIVRGEDREAVHIPNHKFTVNVVRNLTQKTHWRIKTHLAISHLDVSKINNIVADMRKVLAKNPQVEQQKLHRRVFFDNINPENQALMILISCFVKTSHFEEYLCVKEAILLDLLRVIRHHRARLATPIRTMQKIFTDTDVDNVPYSPDSIFNREGVPNRPLLLIEPSYKINGEDKTKPQTRKNVEDESKTAAKSTPENKADPKVESSLNNDPKSRPTTSSSDHMTKEMPTSNAKADSEVAAKSTSDLKVNNNSKPKTDAKSGDETSAVSKRSVSKPSLEENIVLGVALEGSKRTLPIEEEEIATASNSDDMKELAALHSGNGPTVAEKEKNESKRLNSSGLRNDQLDHQE